jgi:hypothetical protein
VNLGHIAALALVGWYLIALGDKWIPDSAARLCRRNGFGWGPSIRKRNAIRLYRRLMRRSTPNTAKNEMRGVS